MEAASSEASNINCNKRRRVSGRRSIGRYPELPSAYNTRSDAPVSRRAETAGYNHDSRIDPIRLPPHDSRIDPVRLPPTIPDSRRRKLDALERTLTSQMLSLFRCRSASHRPLGLLGNYSFDKPRQLTTIKQPIEFIYNTFHRFFANPS